MADRIRGSCPGCLCFRNRGINDLAIRRLERAAFLFDFRTGLIACVIRGALDTTEIGLAVSICFAIVIAVDTRVLSIIKSYECVAVAMNTSKYEWSNGNLSSNRQSNLGPHFCNLVGLLFYYGQDWAMMFKTSKGMTGDFICMEGVQV